jgi:hypothetical protein
MPNDTIIVEIDYDTPSGVRVALWDGQEPFGTPIAVSEAATADEAVRFAFDKITITP